MPSIVSSRTASLQDLSLLGVTIDTYDDGTKSVRVGAGGGVPPQMDDTDKSAVSVYGKASAAGDTPLLVSAAGRTLIAGGLSSTGDGVASGVTLVPDSADTARLLGAGAFVHNGTNWDRAKGDNTGAARVSLYGKGSVAGDTPLYVAALPSSSDALSSFNQNSIYAQVFGMLFDGANWNRARNNQDLTVLASAARTIATNSADIVNYNGRFLRVDIDITAIAGSPSLTFTVKAKDALSGVYSTILASAALVGTGHTVLLIGPGLTPAANLVANAPLPRTFRVEVAVGSADSVTYSIGAVLSN